LQIQKSIKLQLEVKFDTVTSMIWIMASNLLTWQNDYKGTKSNVKIDIVVRNMSEK
jgi:hypothetical protein